MKITLSILASLLFIQGLWSQGCTDLFISEYAEGTGNNKGIEIFNPTSEAIDLGPYVLERWSNGSNSVSDALDLQGTIPALTTWVVVNGQTEDAELGDGSISPAVDVEMQAYADQLDNPYPAPTYMNGDDAIVLIKNGDTPVDIFGKPGEDPGVAWTDNAESGYTSEDGGTWLTANHTLRRKFDVTMGVTLPPTEFNTFLEWDTLAVNTWDGFGSHACGCGSTSIQTYGNDVEFDLYPNPTQDGSLNIQTSLAIEKVEVFDLSGRVVYNEVINANIFSTKVQLDDQLSGLYIVNVSLKGGMTFSKRVQVR